MLGRERILRTLRGEPVDRQPVFYRAYPEVNQPVMRALSLSSPDAVAAYFGSDAVPSPLVRRPFEPMPTGEPDTHYDLYGSLHKTTNRDGLYSDAVIGPVLGAAQSVGEIEAFRMPDIDCIDYEASGQAAQAAHETGLAVYGGAWASIFTLSRQLMGEENFLVGLFEEPEMIAALVGKVTDYFIAINERFFREYAPFVDVFYFGSDFGTQRSLFMGPSEFRTFFKPNMKRLADHAHSFGLPVMFHTCGAVRPLIPDLIEIGIDMLDPVQADAEGMSCDELAQYRGKIVFHGGISTQHTLPFGTPAEVAAETRRLMKALGPGLVVAPDQDMIGAVPVENIEALFRTARAYRPS